MVQVLEHMRALASKHEAPKDSKRLIPADLKAMLPQLGTLYTRCCRCRDGCGTFVQLHLYREGRQNPKSKTVILDAAMSFLEPFSTRSNLQRRLNEQLNNANKQERTHAASVGGDSDDAEGAKVAVQPAPVAT